MQMASLKLMTQHLFWFQAFLLQLLHLSQPSQNWRVRVLLRLWLKITLWLVWSSVQTTQIFSILAIRLLCFLITRVFTGVALSISFKRTLLPFQQPCVEQAFGRRVKRSIGVRLHHAFPTKPYHVCCCCRATSLMSDSVPLMSSFWFKVRNVWFFLSLNTWRSNNWSNIKIVMSQGLGRPKEGKRDGETAGQ